MFIIRNFKSIIIIIWIFIMIESEMTSKTSINSIYITLIFLDRN